MSDETIKLSVENNNITDDFNTLAKLITNMANTIQLPAKYADAKPSQVGEKVASQVKKMKVKAAIFLSNQIVVKFKTPFLLNDLTGNYISCSN